MCRSSSPLPVIAAAAPATARSWSEACLSTTPRVSAIAFSSRSPISRATSVRAQSTDSAIDGAFFSSSSRSRPTVVDQLARDPVVEVGHLRGDDLALALGVRVVEVQVEAAPLERLRQLAARVGGEHDERAAYGGDGAELGDRDLEVGQHLQQQPLDLDVGLVDLVDQQHGRLLAPDRRQQRPGQQELVGEDVVVGLVPRRVAAAAPGCGAAASCSSTRRARGPRRAPRSTAAAPGRRRSPATTAFASSVFPTPAGPSTSSGFSSAPARYAVVAVAGSAR